ncbi:hypothetical protein PsorP6_001418 [Peronosclerospora sorghi]|uniref:Uncharacterized protein n=1 Tax=Peronosclerospora sorghi TaxID=230839 RepID=A0ACC0WUL4_9STRA|nr:hypothetical protein PsorP6_001418 [Peronosclerospora sorghi]
MREKLTPSTGNCMVMVLAEAIQDQNLDAHDQKLKEPTWGNTPLINVFTGELKARSRHEARFTASAASREGVENILGSSHGFASTDSSWSIG